MYPFARGPAIPESLVERGRLRVIQRSARADGVLRGLGYSSEWVDDDLGSGAKIYAQFTVPFDKFMALDFREIVAEKERLFYRVYSSYNEVTETAPIFSGNLRNDGPSLPVSPLYTCTAPSPAPDVSTAIVRVPIFGQPAGGGKASGDVNSDDALRLLSPGSRFLLEIENDSTQGSHVQLTLIYRFIPTEEMEPVT